MKCTIPEIAWHNRDPVLSLDIQQREDNFYRLASGGTDCHVLIWHLRILENGAVEQEVVCDLTRHQRSVNVVRWSSSGTYLASGDDDANIIIWTLKTDNIPSLDGDNEKENKEIWNVFKVFRGHKEDVYDICWSPDETKLISGSIDNTAILWDFQKGKNELILKDHKGFVQGCAWDPKGDLIATLSSDRMCRIFSANGKQLKARVGKGKLPVPESHSLYDKEVKYFHDDTFKSYFRRLCFSPDGNLLITPSGCVETEDSKKAMHATYIFTLESLPQPAVILPTPKQSTVAVKCCPILFELRPECGDPVVNLPYRIIIAIATDCDIILYDTQQTVPFAVLQNIHYTRITDITWSSDARLLAASSTDGFCTLITFEPNELGTPYKKEEPELEDSILNVSGCAEIEDDEEKPETIEEEEVKVDVKPKKPNLLEQWAIKTPKRQNDAKINVDEQKTRKRINPIMISASPKQKSTVSTPVEMTVSSTVKNVCNSPADDTNKTIIKRINPIKVVETPNKRIKLTPVSKESTSKNIMENAQNKSPRASPLVNFIQKFSSGKSKTGKYSVLTNKENTGSCEIVEILDEDEARDAWKVESADHISLSNDSLSREELMKAVVHEKTLTDAPDDFKLTMDETSIQEPPKEPVKTPRRVPFVTISTKADKRTSMDKKSDDSSSNSKMDAKKTEQNEKESVVKEIPKTPRRVPLITLSSPRHKKKKST